MSAKATLILLLVFLSGSLVVVGARPSSSFHASARDGALPDAEPPVPPGPNREEFAALCRLCHSPSLVLTQPRFSEKKWSEVVHKMVTVYGAPIPAEQEREIVVYLVSIRGPE